LTDPPPKDGSTPLRAGAAAPTIAATAGSLVTGEGFLPGHHVTICVTYTAEDISDYLTYTADSGGDLHAELPTSPTAGTLRVTATDHRSNPEGACGLLWSNTHTLTPPKP
jgi:predicted enzyme related to lactoylglutathione lyase